MKPHLLLAHQYWQAIVKPGDTIIDATAGNGYDALFLANLLQGKGKLCLYDIQKKALDNTKEKLNLLAVPDFVRFHHRSHEFFVETHAKLIVYNLGYLPRGDKKITTLSSTTISSLKAALEIASRAISITCYPGHEEGKKEEHMILEFLKDLPSNSFEVCYHQWINRKNAPSLIWLKLPS